MLSDNVSRSTKDDAPHSAFNTTPKKHSPQCSRNALHNAFDSAPFHFLGTKLASGSTNTAIKRGEMRALYFSLPCTCRSADCHASMQDIIMKLLYNDDTYKNCCNHDVIS